MVDDPRSAAPTRLRSAPPLGRRLAAAALACVSVLAAGCSSSGSSASPRSRSAGAGAGSGTVACTRPVAAKVQASPVPGVASDLTITSFDGTKLRAHWFPEQGANAESPAPTVLMGPGWSLPGDTNLTGPTILGGQSITGLRKAGYNVLTWDPRGFGKSTGTVTVDSAAYEGRDVSRLIDWVAEQPQAQLDAPGDPRMGMVGGSYGGGIQLVVAATDCRVDAIVPGIAWHSLSTSLYKADIEKAGWAGVLSSVGGTGRLDPHITHAAQSAKATGQLDSADLKWFAARGPGDLVKKIRVPTLIVQGTSDTLFTLDEGVTNYRLLRDAGVPVSMMWFCGGHGVCLDDPGPPQRVADATIAWLDRWVRRDTSVVTGPRVELIDQHGKDYGVADYPVALGTPLVATGSGTLQLVAGGGSGPLVPPAGLSDPLVGLASPIMPGKATNAVDVRIDPGGRSGLVVGAPALRLAYKGTVAPGDRPVRVFAQLVDDRTGFVVGEQVTPVPVVLDGQPHTVDVPLEIVSRAFGPGDTLTLQLVATTVAYAQPRLGGSVDFSEIHVSLPVARDLKPAS